MNNIKIRILIKIIHECFYFLFPINPIPNLIQKFRVDIQNFVTYCNEKIYIY